MPGDYNGEPQKYLKKRNKLFSRYISNFNKSHVIFEKSATYFDNTDAAKQVSVLLPSANVVVILYDPALRAYSWYQVVLIYPLQKFNFSIY